MRGILVGILALAALWRAWIDWQATIGQGFAYRLTSIETALRDSFSDATARAIAALQGTGIPYLWDPIGRVILSLPLTLVLAGLAALIWVTRRRAR